MSRRESRSSLGARQNDALFEFENFKKKFLLANKHITKLNSTLSVRIEELNAQISSLYVENLRLRASEIALAAQLKREQEKSRKVMADAEAVSYNLTKHLSYLRETLNIKNVIDTPPTPPSPRARRPVVNVATTPTSPGFGRISRPPNVPGINEDDEPCSSSSEENHKAASPPRKKAKTKPRLSASKLPLPTRATSPSIAMAEPPTIHHLDLTTIPSSTTKRKASRRQSGLLTVNTEALSVPRSGSPAFGSPIRLEAGRAEEEEEYAAVHGHIVEVADPEVSKPPIQKKEKRKGKSKDSEGSKESAGEGLPPPKKEKLRDEEEGADLARPKSREAGASRTALQPIDSNVRELVDHDSSKAPGRQFLSPVSPAPSAPTSRGSSSPAPGGSSDAEGLANGTAGRERRTRKSVKNVNYAEPKLNTKMRKPDPQPSTEPPRVKKRASAAAAMPTTAYRPPSPTELFDGNDAQSDTEARSPVEFQPPSLSLPLRGLNGNYINPELFPLPPSRPGSAAAMYSPGPPTRTSGSTATSSSSSSLASVATSNSRDGSTTIKRKKSRPQVIISDGESDDGAEADAEFVIHGRGATGATSAWVNVDGRRKALPKRSAAAAAVVALEDIRRHSMAI